MITTKSYLDVTPTSVLGLRWMYIMRIYHYLTLAEEFDGWTDCMTTALVLFWVCEKQCVRLSSMWIHRSYFPLPRFHIETDVICETSSICKHSFICKQFFLWKWIFTHWFVSWLSSSIWNMNRIKWGIWNYRVHSIVTITVLVVYSVVSETLTCLSLVYHHN